MKIKNPVFITNTVSKKSLEKILKEIYINFGKEKTCALLDHLKFLGFSYATSSGISLSIEDLRIPFMKKELVKAIDTHLEIVSENWDQGYVTELERFRDILNSWETAAKILEDKIKEYYDIYDPLNSLYMMSSSGARGNITQVKQLIGMRGLMSDHEGNVINLPIKANFREGLTLVDYLISAHGARKGVIDTSLKTAEAGYLTRRLVFVAQDLIIKEIDCGTKSGIGFFFSRKTIKKRSEAMSRMFLGRYLANYKSITSKSSYSSFVHAIFDSEAPIFTEAKIEKLKQDWMEAGVIVLRSPLTCESVDSVCQLCYGFDFGKRKIVELGYPAGTIAGQSIGEPGTQLTMRTFHTGGVVATKSSQNLQTKCDGMFILPPIVDASVVRNEYGKKIHILNRSISCLFYPRLDFTKDGNLSSANRISLSPGTILYITSSRFVYSKEVFGEFAISDIQKELNPPTKIKSVLVPIESKLYLDDPVLKFEKDFEMEVLQNELKNLQKGTSVDLYSDFYKFLWNDRPKFLPKFLLEEDKETGESPITVIPHSELTTFNWEFTKKLQSYIQWEMTKKLDAFCEYKLLKKDIVLSLASQKFFCLPTNISETIYLYEKKAIAKIAIKSPFAGRFRSLKDSFLFEKLSSKNFLFDSIFQTYNQQTFLEKDWCLGMNILKKELVNLHLHIFDKKEMDLNPIIICLKQDLEHLVKDSILAYLFLFPKISEPIYFFQKENNHCETKIFEIEIPGIISPNSALDPAKNILDLENPILEMDQILKIQRTNLIEKRVFNFPNLMVKNNFLCKSDTWILESNEITNFSSKDSFVHSRQKFNEKNTIAFSGKFLAQQGSKSLFQHFSKMLFIAGNFLKTQAILNEQHFSKNFPIGKVFTSTQRASDITQGLPKIQKYVEARGIPAKYQDYPAEFSLFAGVAMNSRSTTNLELEVENQTVRIYYHNYRPESSLRSLVSVKWSSKLTFESNFPGGYNSDMDNFSRETTYVFLKHDLFRGQKISNYKSLDNQKRKNEILQNCTLDMIFETKKALREKISNKIIRNLNPRLNKLERERNGFFILKYLLAEYNKKAKPEKAKKIFDKIYLPYQNDLGYPLYIYEPMDTLDNLNLLSEKKENENELFEYSKIHLKMLKDEEKANNKQKIANWKSSPKTFWNIMYNRVIRLMEKPEIEILKELRGLDEEYWQHYTILIFWDFFWKFFTYEQGKKYIPKYSSLNYFYQNSLRPNRPYKIENYFCFKTYPINSSSMLEKFLKAEKTPMEKFTTKKMKKFFASYPKDQLSLYSLNHQKNLKAFHLKNNFQLDSQGRSGNKQNIYLDSRGVRSYGRKSNEIYAISVPFYYDHVIFDYKFQRGKFVSQGYNSHPGFTSARDILRWIFEAYLKKAPSYLVVLRALVICQFLWISGISAIYEGQGVNILSKHFELIIKQMTTKVSVLSTGIASHVFVGEMVPKFALFSISRFCENENNKILFVLGKFKNWNFNDVESLKILEKSLKNQFPKKYNLIDELLLSELTPEENLRIANKLNIEEAYLVRGNQKEWTLDELEMRIKREDFLPYPEFEPIIQGSSRSGMEKNNILSNAGFREPKVILTKAAVSGKIEWFNGLKECVAAGKLIPAGTGFLTKSELQKKMILDKYLKNTSLLNYTYRYLKEK